MNFLSFTNQLIQQKKAVNQEKTARNYLSACRAFNSFLEANSRQKLDISDIDTSLIELFEAHLLQHLQLKRNTSSAYMRSLRAAYNMAVRQNLCADRHPFRTVYTGVDATRKRAVAHTELQRLFQAQLPNHLYFSRDLFLFSFLAHGIAFIDLVQLRIFDIKGRHLYYSRSKTKQRISVPLSAYMQQIIHRYHQEGQTRLFPIVGETFSQRTYDTALHRYNQDLYNISSILELSTPLTSYCARHSWASEAYRLSVPLSVISTCMGHTSEQTTRIYLQSLDTDYLDEQTSVVERNFQL